MTLFERFYRIIRQIPRGRVATYGQIARLAGLPRHARHVGYALAVCPDDVPWQRVINAKGEISLRAVPEFAIRQCRRLAQEGVRFDKQGRVSLARYQWRESYKTGKRKVD